MKLDGKLFASIFFALALTSCSTLHEGRIVSKRYRPSSPDFAALGATYTVVIQGNGPRGKARRRTVIVNEDQWARLEIGDYFSVSERSGIPALFKGRSSQSGKSAEQQSGKSSAAEMEQSEKAETVPARARESAENASASHSSKAEKTKPSHENAKAVGTPAAKPAASPKSSPSPKPSASPKATASPSSSVSAKPSPKASPSPKPAPTAASSAATKKELSFDEAAAKAAEDPRTRELKQKIHNARSDEEQRKAADDYYKALYGRMRELAPSAKDRIDKEEAAKLRH
jgi:flagellar hook-associated protein FlgK